MGVQIEESWKRVLQDEFKQDYFIQLTNKIKTEIKSGKTIYPSGKDIFSAFNQCPFNKVKVVILGQDPYHGPKQAHGLCFSVQKGIIVPPSLKNIYKELAADVQFVIPSHGNLSSWARQGVFMLNATLTVEQAKPNSHSKWGWSKFTDKVIQKISQEKEGVVFLLWGKFAQTKATFIDERKHKILMAAHPSPFSAHNGFFGCRHFSSTNDYLCSLGKEEIKWQF